MAKTNVSVDVHSLAVVWNRITKISASGNVSYPESWMKVKILGGEGSISAKFALLYASKLQFKITTAERERDARSTDTYYPRGAECAQLFSVLADMIGVVPMEDFDGTKWADRMPKGCLAKLRLIEYTESLATPKDKAPAKGKGKGKNRLATDETIPATEAPAVDATVNGETVPV